MRRAQAAMKLRLASGSPRRRELLEQLGLELEIAPADIDETALAGESPIEYVGRLALAKAAVVAGELVLAADTTVELDGEILAKPLDAADAARMLRALSGREHQVHTGVALRHAGRTELAVVSTDVTFAALDEATIAWYVATGEPLDKAGAYAIQGAGAVLVAGVRGSVSNVVGLPLATVVELARRLGVALLPP
jgi:septum formation protein